MAGNEQDGETLDWLGVKANEHFVETYFRKHADGELDVPLMIARQVREETIAQMAKELDASDAKRAMWQGMVVAMERFAKVYLEGVRQQGRWLASGGKGR